ncbi:MAG: hypothetical protein H6709_08385 [Kofleriaceae bacterium]|nr:hypothetical protein [Kofleriaceae bacterium]
MTGLGAVRPEERRLIGRAAVVAALGGAGGAMAASGADALFLAHVGARHLGGALAASSALLAVVLAVIGGLADRLDRRRLLGGAPRRRPGSARRRWPGWPRCGRRRRASPAWSRSSSCRRRSTSRSGS